MGTLAITKTYAAQTPLFEVDIDAFRNGLLQLFNTDLLSASNFSGSIALTSTHFTGTSLIPIDDDYITFGATADGVFGIDATKALLFNTLNSTQEIRFIAGPYYMELTNDKLQLPGDIIINKGGSGRTILQALSSYRKPVIEWSSTTGITLQNNTGTANETVLYLPTSVIAVTEASPAKYRFAQVTASANGYQTSTTGAALGGRRSGVSATTNSWFYCYAVGLRSSTNYSASNNKFIIVFDTVSPSSDNAATLDGYYGSGNYAYMGLVRYGYGATGSSSVIPKFIYSNKGWCTFYGADTGMAGVNLAYTTTDADNTATALYTLASGTSGNVLPPTIGHIRLNLFRSRVSDWKMRETSSAASDVIWSGGWQTYDGTIAQGFLIEIPNITGYSVFQERKSNSAGTARGVTLAGFVDGYMLNRRHGHGI